MAFMRTGIIGVCSKCGVACELEVRPDYFHDDFVKDCKENRGTIKTGICPNCNQESEFVPAPKEGANTPGQKVLAGVEARFEEHYREKGIVVSED